MKLNLDNSAKFLKPCPECGSVIGRDGPGTQTHAARVECDGCGRFLSWMPFWFAAAIGLIEKID